MYNKRIAVLIAAVALLAILSINNTFAQEATALKGILIGNGWNTVTKELDTVYTDQSTIELGIENSKKVQLWTVIENGQGLEITWVIEYSNGMREEPLVQTIRYNRFRTYLEKTFRRKLLDQNTKQYVDITGACKIMLVDKQNQNRVLAEKALIIK